jgi:RND superfamily putative drug exporter
MAGLLYRIGRFAFRRKWTVVVSWLLIIIAAVGADKAFAGTLSSTVTIPGIEAPQASNTMHAKFGASSEVSGELVFQAPDGRKVTATAYKAAIDEATTQAAKVTGVVSTVSPFTAKTISANGTTAYTTIVAQATARDRDGNGDGDGTARNPDGPPRRVQLIRRHLSGG